MGGKMSLKPTVKTTLNLKKIIIYTILGGSMLSILIYIGLIFFGIIGNPTKVLAAQVTGYSWDAVVTVDHNKVYGQDSLIDFPVVFKIINPALKSVTNGGKVENINGFDIVFSDMNNNQLDHQIECYNPTTGEYIAWVRIPTLFATVNTQIKLFYGNSNVTTDPSTENVWNVNYEGVWHMNNNPSGNLLDDGSGNNDANDYGGMNVNDLVIGKIGKAIDFDGTNDRYAIKNKNYSTVGEIPLLTVSGWFKTTFSSGGWNNNWSMLDFDRSEYFNVFVHGNGKVGFSTRGSGVGQGSGINDFNAGNIGEYNDGNWHYLVAVYDGVNKYLYVDGILAATENNAHGGLPIGRGTLTRYGFIGDGSEAEIFNGNRDGIHYKGQYDEVRFLNTNLASNWIATEYENQNSPNTFYNIVFSSSPLPVELTAFNVELIDNSVEITWTTASEINNDYFTIEKSIDAENYETLDEVTGAGNSQEILNYDYFDYEVNEGVTYYRLKQTDFDGKFEYFPPKSVSSQSDISSLKILKVKPNPFVNQFIVEIQSEKSDIIDFNISNMNGKTVHSSKININESITEYTYNNGNKLSPGTYVLTLIQVDEKPVSIKIVKK
jgi:hypothetical protein